MLKNNFPALRCYDRTGKKKSNVRCPGQILEGLLNIDQSEHGQPQKLIFY